MTSKGKSSSLTAPSSPASSSREVVAASWSHLQELLFDASWNDDIKRHRSRHAFRGHSVASYKLEPGLMGIGGDYWERERHLLRNFKKYAHRNVVERDAHALPAFEAPRHIAKLYAYWHIGDRHLVHRCFTNELIDTI